MIEFRNVTFCYPGSAPILDGFSWRVARGEAWAILGPSGCGKTTLLYLLAGLRPPTSGQILIEGAPLVRPRPRTGLILQEYGLLPWFTARENVELGPRIRAFYGADGKHAPVETMPASAGADAWLARLGLTAVEGQYPSQLSGGQRQRVAIARTLLLGPDLLLMDEPFSSLDAQTRENLQDLTLELLLEQHLTLVLVTHSIEEAAILGRRILVFERPLKGQPRVVENLGAGGAGYRGTEEYLAVCRTLRQELRAA